MHNAGVPTKHIQRISGNRTLAALSGYLEVTDEQVEGAIADLFSLWPHQLTVYHL